MANIYHVVRGERQPGHRQSLASRHAPYGYSHRGGRTGGLQHLVRRVVIQWKQPVPELAAAWRCGGESIRASLLHVADLDSMCRTCRLILDAEALGAIEGRPCIYYAQRADGLIKIGWSGNVGMRVASLKAQLLAVEQLRPGASEVSRHAEFSRDHVAHEWHKPTPRLLSHIASLTHKEVA